VLSVAVWALPVAVAGALTVTLVGLFTVVIVVAAGRFGVTIVEPTSPAWKPAVAEVTVVLPLVVARSATLRTPMFSVPPVPDPVAAAEIVTLVELPIVVIVAPLGMFVPWITRPTSAAVKLASAEVTVVLPLVTASATVRGSDGIGPVVVGQAVSENWMALAAITPPLFATRSVPPDVRKVFAVGEVMLMTPPAGPVDGEIVATTAAWALGTPTTPPTKALPATSAATPTRAAHGRLLISELSIEPFLRV